MYYVATALATSYKPHYWPTALYQAKNDSNPVQSSVKLLPSTYFLHDFRMLGMFCSKELATDTLQTDGTPSTNAEFVLVLASTHRPVTSPRYAQCVQAQLAGTIITTVSQHIFRGANKSTRTCSLPFSTFIPTSINPCTGRSFSLQQPLSPQHGQPTLAPNNHSVMIIPSFAILRATTTQTMDMQPSSTQHSYAWVQPVLTLPCSLHHSILSQLHNEPSSFIVVAGGGVL